MNILLTSTSFFGYSERVAAEMRRQGHTVTELYSYRRTSYERLFKRMGPNQTTSEKNYYLKILEQDCNNTYDVVLVFGGGTPLWVVDWLKDHQSESAFILYLSADNSSYKFDDEYFSRFNKIFSYSLTESEQYGFTYQPWFFSDIQVSEKKYDVSFVGSIHDVRHQYLTNLKKDTSLQSYIYIYIDRISYLKRFIKWRALNKYVHFKGLAYNQYIKLLSESQCTLDIPTSEQTNITTRPIESLGTRTKIITTNKNIVNYDFYNPNNILIVSSPLDISGIKEWLKKPYVEIENSIITKYRIESWVRTVLNG